VLINLIIIYFACGSPIGVYRITRATRLRWPSQAATVGVYFVLWPIFAPAILRRSLLVGETDIQQAIAIIRSSLETIAFAGSPAISVFEFREVFARYTGLTLALNSGGSANPSTDLLRVAGHTNVSLAAACVGRRDRKRLKFHQQQARDEFFEIVSAMAGAPKVIEIVGLSLRLAALLNDREIAGRFSLLKKGIAG
jgi:hypothetical protein